MNEVTLQERRIRTIAEATRHCSNASIELGTSINEMLECDYLSLQSAADTIRKAIKKANDGLNAVIVAEQLAADIEAATNRRLGIASRFPSPSSFAGHGAGDDGLPLAGNPVGSLVDVKA